LFTSALSSEPFKKKNTLKMSQADLDKSIEIITKTEELADKIMANKKELSVMDKRRQETREALRLMEKSEDKKVWITIGSMLVKMEKEKALYLLKKGCPLLPITNPLINKCFLQINTKLNSKST